MTDPAEWIPFGQLATRQWLQEQGVSRHALDNALKSGKLTGLARGVVARPGVPVGWRGVVASLDRMASHPVYVGGLSAMAEAGLAHYVSLAQRVHLYSPAARPSWLRRLPLEVAWAWHSTVRLWDLQALMASGSLREQPLENGGYWRLASPEQAFLEVLADLPGSLTFEHADNLMQGLSALSPRRLDLLLYACRHVRTKRLFFFFADRYNYPWRKHLRAEDYDLGKGKRSVVSGGKLDPTWLITVPEDFHGPK